MVHTHSHNILLDAQRHNQTTIEERINHTITEERMISSLLSLDKNVFLVLLLLTSLSSFLSFSRIYHKCCLLAPPCLSGGVFLALLFLDLFPAVSHSMAATDIDLEIFPFGRFIVVTSFIAVIFCEQAVMQWKERADEKEKTGGGKTLLSKCRKTFLSQNIVRSLFLIFSLSIHNGLEGISLGLSWSDSTTHHGIPTILQKSLVSACLGFSLARLSPSLVMFQCLVYCGSILVGVVMALGAGQWMDGAELTVAVLHGTSAGIFLYILFFEILPHQLNGPGNRLGKVFFAMFGFLVAAGVVTLI